MVILFSIIIIIIIIITIIIIIIIFFIIFAVVIMPISEVLHMEQINYTRTSRVFRSYKLLAWNFSLWKPDSC